MVEKAREDKAIMVKKGRKILVEKWTWVCTICKKEYKYKRDAIKCEKGHQYQKFLETHYGMR